MLLRLVQVAEQTSSEVLGNDVELLGIVLDVSLELLRVFGILIESLLLLDDILEVSIASCAVPCLTVFGLNALIMESVAAHEMNCG